MIVKEILGNILDAMIEGTDTVSEISFDKNITICTAYLPSKIHLKSLVIHIYIISPKWYNVLR